MRVDKMTSFRVVDIFVIFLCATNFILCGEGVRAAGLSDAVAVTSKFRRSLNNFDHGYLVLNVGEENIERFEVRPGDCSENRSWSDCKNGRERSEMRSHFHGAREETWWYRWEIFVPEGTPDLYPAKTYFGQLHQRGGAPVLMFRYKRGALLVEKHIGNGPGQITILGPENFTNKWISLRVDVKWSFHDGYFKVYVNDVMAYEFYGKTCDKNEFFFKYGIYKSHLHRYIDSSAKDIYESQVIYYKNVDFGRH